MIRVAIANEQCSLSIDEDRLRRAVSTVLEHELSGSAEISLAIVDDETIRRLNRRHLGHDYETDVLSFVLEQEAGHLDAEVIVSGDRAAAEAPAYGWSPDDELLLYVIHGSLHLAGYDDASTADRERMREREAHYLEQLGAQPHEGRRPAAGAPREGD